MPVVKTKSTHARAEKPLKEYAGKRDFAARTHPTGVGEVRPRPSDDAVQWSVPDGGTANDSPSTYQKLEIRISSPDGESVTCGADRLVDRPLAAAGSLTGSARELRTVTLAVSTTSMPLFQPDVP